jgi:hypothetical protein
MTFKYIVISDIHLGHPRNKTHEILFNLNKAFNYFNEDFHLNAIFIAGDFFDTLLDNYTSDYHEIVIWIHRLINYCARKNIKLRVLEGTPSHDWNQCKIFETLISVTGTPIDFKYVNSIYIEFLEDNGLYILYVPDEAMESSEITREYIKQLLIDKGISSVDIAIMHGMFGYQMMNIQTSQTHDEKFYNNIVNYYIHIGHIHTHSKYDKIIAQGSFDRLSHNEEEPKGYIIAEVNNIAKFCSWNFIENKTAKIFKTINITKNQNLEQALIKLDKNIYNLPELSFVRIKASKDHIVYQAFEELKKRYLLYNLSKKSDDDHSDSNQLIDDVSISIEYDVITINKENIEELLFNCIDKQLIDITQLKNITTSIKDQI